MKTARIDAAAVVINNLMWVTGGNSPTNFLKSTEFYDFQTDTWTSGPDLPVELKKHSMSIIDNNTVIITGGESSKNFLYCSSWELCHFEVKILTLAELIIEKSMIKTFQILRDVMIIPI